MTIFYTIQVDFCEIPATEINNDRNQHFSFQSVSDFRGENILGVCTHDTVRDRKRTQLRAGNVKKQEKGSVRIIFNNNI